MKLAAEQSTFSLEERPAKASASRGYAGEWLIRVETSRSPILRSLTDIGPAGAFGKTSPVSCHREQDGTLVPSSAGWSNSGMGSPTECLTLNTCEWTDWSAPCRSDDGVCSLSDILETGAVPQRFYLSAKACRGILRRAEKRGKTLPLQLAHALLAVADSAPISIVTAD